LKIGVACMSVKVDTTYKLNYLYAE
jgi:hypothetical protein